jgi:hypothetical protein
MRFPCLVLLVLGAGCASVPRLRTAPPLPPTAVEATDHAGGFVVAPVRAWSLVGDDLTPGHDTIELEVTAADDTQVVDAWLNDRPGVRLQRAGTSFTHTLDLRDLEPGTYEILLAADGAERAFARLEFTRTPVLYVVTSTDWDTADNPDENLERHVELHRRHPELLITHLLGPYTFTDLTLSPLRVDELVQWACGMRDTYGDEIGVHIHPYKSLVEAAYVPFRSGPTGTGPEDPTGYGVNLSAYSEDELTAMLELTTAIFEENGLGRPTSFRAGAWNADIDTMRALANAGFLVDTSALNVARLEEWQGQPLHDWVSTNWAPIDDRSQPYYPNQGDVLSSAAPHVPVLQVPDNGVLVDYVSGAEMIEVFRNNWAGGALDEPRVVSIGWHPPNFGERYMQRIDEALTEFDRHLASRDAGPVVYARLSDMVRVWKLR